MSETQQYLTKEKFDEFVKELEHLTTERRQEIAEQLEYARSLGDLSENAEYKEARELQGALEGRIKELESILADVQVVTNKDTDVVSIGNKVTIIKVGDKDKAERTYTIVGSAEADIKERKISHMSPLGEALMNKKKGQIFEFETPGGSVKYKVVNVS